MMKDIGRNMKAVFPACVQAAVFAGFMLSGMPFGMTASAGAPCAHPGLTQTDSTRIHHSTSGHVDSHAAMTGRREAEPFDMNVLIERLKKTDAIGMFTKLALRSDALDIMDMIKAYNRHIARYSLKELRARFNGLVLKVLALLDDDPMLSRDISLAREKIWKSLLTQEVKA